MTNESVIKLLEDLIGNHDMLLADIQHLITKSGETLEKTRNGLLKGKDDQVKNLNVTELLKQARCQHTLGLLYWEESIDNVITTDNVTDLKSNPDYNENDYTWFKYCPYCGKLLQPVDRDE